MRKMPPFKNGFYYESRTNKYDVEFLNFDCSGTNSRPDVACYINV